jgi:hypothetical protein
MYKRTLHEINISSGFSNSNYKFIKKGFTSQNMIYESMVTTNDCGYDIYDGNDCGDDDDDDEDDADYE